MRTTTTTSHDHGAPHPDDHAHDHDHGTARPRPRPRRTDDERGRRATLLQPDVAGLAGAAGGRLQLFRRAGGGGRSRACVADEAQAGDWLLDQLQLALARCDLARGRAGPAAPGGGRRGARRRAQRLGAHRRRETRRAAPAGRADGPLAAGLAAQRRRARRCAPAARCAALAPGADLAGGLRAGRRAGRRAAARALLAFAFGWAENMVQAAMKAVPLGQSARPAPARAAGRRDPGRRRRRAGTARRCPPGLRADAGHPLGAARNPVLAAVQIMTAARAAPHSRPHQEAAALARGRRRPGRLGQDDAGGDAVQDHARALGPGGRHQRHLHQGRPAPAHRVGRAGARAHHGRGDRRLPAHRDPRGRLDQPRGRRPHAREVPRRRHRLHRIRRRQPGRHLQPRAERPDDLRHRRRRRREDPAQGRARHHQERPVRHQQDRPRAPRGRQPGR